MTKDLKREQDLKLFYFSYLLPNASRVGDFGMGYDAEDLLQTVKSSKKIEGLTLSIHGQLPVKEIIQEVNKREEPEQMTKEKFIHSLLYTADSLVMDKKDRKTLKAIINKIK